MMAAIEEITLPYMSGCRASPLRPALCGWRGFTLFSLRCWSLVQRCIPKLIPDEAPSSCRSRVSAAPAETGWRSRFASARASPPGCGRGKGCGASERLQHGLDGHRPEHGKDGHAQQPEAAGVFRRHAQGLVHQRQRLAGTDCVAKPSIGCCCKRSTLEVAVITESECPG
jgi:hypothetical protein